MIKSFQFDIRALSFPPPIASNYQTMPPKKKSKVDDNSTKPADDEDDTDVETIDEEYEEENDEDLGRGKRKRRESQNYEPADFTLASTSKDGEPSAVPQGRGDKLGDIAGVNTSINSYKLNTEELLSAYKFVFSNRGTSNRKLMKEKLLDFSGYLPPLPKGKYDVDKQDEEDEVYEVSTAWYSCFVLKVLLK